MPKPSNMQRGASDDFQTPPEALLPLLPFLKKRWTIWEPAAGKGLLVKDLRRRGFKVIATDLLTHQDFLRYEPKENYHCILTNPPFSIKNQFIARCYELKKPFALLLPLSALESKARQRLYREHGLELILYDKRINFVTPSGQGSGSWFATAWYTHGLNLPNPLTFVHLP